MFSQRLGGRSGTSGKIDGDRRAQPHQIPVVTDVSKGDQADAGNETIGLMAELERLASSLSFSFSFLLILSVMFVWRCFELANCSAMLPRFSAVTLMAWASMRASSRRRLGRDGGRCGEPSAGGGGHAEADFHARRSNDTHASTTDPDARLYRKGQGRRPALLHGTGLMENRHGLLVDACLTLAYGMANGWPRCT